MDLHQLGSSLWYFHVVDECTRFSNAVIVHTKSLKIIAEKFLQMWIIIFGPPRQIFLENGGDFVKTFTLILKQHQPSLLGQMDIVNATTRFSAILL